MVVVKYSSCTYPTPLPPIILLSNTILHERNWDIDTEWEIMDLLNYTVPRVPAGNSILFTWDLPGI